MRRVLGIAVVIVCLVAVPASAKTSPSKACIKALDDSEQIRLITVEGLRAVSDHLSAVGDSARKNSGNVNQFLDDMNASLRTLSSTVNTATAKLNPYVESYNVNAPKCRAGK